MKVSVLILTYNEAANLPRCIDSLVGIEDIVVVDSGSTDETCAIAHAAGARVLIRPFDNFANQRNFGLKEGVLKHDWVLHLDADEVLTPEFLDALMLLSPPDALDGYRVPSKMMLNGKWLRHAGMYPSYQVRLARQRLRFVQVGHGQREDAPAERLGIFPEPYLHYNFSHGLTQWFVKHVQYAEDEARQIEADRRGRLLKLHVFQADSTDRRRALKALVNNLPLLLRPPLRFFYVLVVRRGFMDGRAGLQYALMLSAYEAMIASMALTKG